MRHVNLTTTLVRLCEAKFRAPGSLPPSTAAHLSEQACRIQENDTIVEKAILSAAVSLLA